jgi:hypothetical protein
MEQKFGGKRSGRRGKCYKWKWEERCWGSKMTAREVIQGELGWNKISSRRELLRLNFWSKIITMKKEDRLIYKVYRARKDELIAGGYKDKKNWCYWTWKFLQNLNLEHLWQSEKIELGSNFSNVVKKLVARKEESEWREEIEKKPKLRLYKKLKSRLVLEEYVLDLEREQRRHLTMLRGGTNKLRIETGRWSNESEPARVCNVCLCCEVEDERHFLLCCPRYVKERIEMFEKIKNEAEGELDYIENMNEEWQIQFLIGVGWNKKGKEIRKIVEYIRKHMK